MHRVSCQLLRIVLHSSFLFSEKINDGYGDAGESPQKLFVSEVLLTFVEVTGLVIISQTHILVLLNHFWQAGIMITYNVQPK